MLEVSQGEYFRTSFFFLEKALNELKTNDPQISFNILWQPSIWNKIKTNFYKTLNPKIYSYFDFLEKDLEIVFLHFQFDFCI